jgi:hypothetical protein
MDELQDATLSTTLSHPVGGKKQQDTVARCAEADIDEIPSAVNPRMIPSPVPIPTIIASGLSSLPIVLSALFGDTTTTEPTHP